MSLSTRFRKSSHRAGSFLFLKLLILLCLVKLLFILFNPFLFNEPHSVRWIKTLAWGLLYDVILLLLFMIPLKVLPEITRQPVTRITLAAILSFFVLLNLADAFYFRFHHQRASADLLYVLSAAEGSFVRHFLVAFAAVSVIGGMVWIVNRWLKIFGEHAKRSFLPLLLLPALFILPAGMLLPSYPLTVLQSNELMIAQNSLHTFAYSVFRKEESSLLPFKYMDDDEAAAIFQNSIQVTSSGARKNIMLFIMESVPADFFMEGPYKTSLPFFDSLLQRSYWYRNAYSYSHNSNKGITAILAGLPTLTDIPLYHSGYSVLDKTSVGHTLKQKGYETGFFIGDVYDGFGFAKFCNWTGIDYFSKEDMDVPPGTDRHTLGLHDAQVAEFVSDRIKQVKKPFFSVFYNLTTHFPNDLPKHYISDPSLTTPMNAMRYYDEVVGNFFRTIEREAWFKNTVFVFCSDHWMYPDHKNESMDPAGSFRIPVIIFDPEKDTSMKINNPVSQLDIMPTVLSYAGIDTTVISYGKLLGNSDSARIVFARENNFLYQAFDREYVLGLNVVKNRVEFLYRLDTFPRENLAGKGFEAEARLQKALQAFLQVAADHYRGK